jgi:integrase
MDGFRGTFVVKCAIKLSLLVMLRPGELRHGEWSEIDFDEATWTIPASRMKARKTTKEENLTTHIVPLSAQALEILKELKPLTGRFPYIFTGARNRNRPMSENAVNAALRSLGFSNEQMTAHGFRATASTFLNEMGFNPDAIEAQLAHKDKNEIRAAYNRAQYLDERRAMLQSWADYVENIKFQV